MNERAEVKQLKGEIERLWQVLEEIYAPDFDSLPRQIAGCGDAVRQRNLPVLEVVLGITPPQSDTVGGEGHDGRCE